VNMARIGAVLLAMVGLAQSQADAPVSRPQFDVASIKPSGACEGGGVPQPGRLKLKCLTVGSLIQMAHGYFANGSSYTPRILQISGAHGWVDSDRYDIEATAEGNPSQALMRGPMLKALLESRFKLRFHNEIKEGTVYVLTVARNGVKIPPTAENSCTPVDLSHTPPVSGLGSAPTNLCGTETRQKKGQTLTVNVHGISMPDLADGILAELTGQTVVDKTGLGGLFEFHIEFTPDRAPPNNIGSAVSIDENAGASIFVALQEQLGLKLESAKGPVKMFVIDHIERPSGN
jgi:uncharacterized protein (TIGR03435 family)